MHGYVLWKCFASGSSSGSHFLFRKWDQTQACHVLNAEHEPLHECRCMWASRPQQQQHVQSHLQTIPRGLQEHFYCYKLKGWNHIRQEYICFLLETLPPSHWACMSGTALWAQAYDAIRTSFQLLWINHCTGPHVHPWIDWSLPNIHWLIISCIWRMEPCQPPKQLKTIGACQPYDEIATILG